MTTHALPTRRDSIPTGPNHAGHAVPRRSTAGATAALMELPDSSELTPSEPSVVLAHLNQIEVVRQQQLDALPSTNLDTVAAAYRHSLERMLEEVRTARRRLEAGLYGVCIGCSDDIPLERLELRPWATACPPCASRNRA